MVVRDPYEIDVDALVLEDRVHKSVYSDPKIFDLEMERIWGRIWVYIGHESEVPNPGDYKSWWLAGEPVILSRHADGSLRVLFNRCPHRGAIVCRDNAGTSSYFRCAYHGWTFANDGKLLGAPWREAYGDYELPEGLAEVPRVESYRGFVFASLDPDVVSLDEFLGNFKEAIDDTVEQAPAGEIIVRSGVHKYSFKGNWKFQAENVIDGYHPPFSHESDIHRPTFTVGREDAALQTLPDEDRPARGDRNGGVHAFPWGHSYSYNETPERRTGPIIEEYFAGLAKRWGQDRVDAWRASHKSIGNKVFYPSVVIQGFTHIRCIIPRSVDYTEVWVYPIALKGAPQAMNEGAIRYLNLTHAASSLQQTDDQEMFWRNQLGLRTSKPDWLILARGLHREEDGPGAGERLGRSTDELPFRNQFRTWKELMRRP